MNLTTGFMGQVVAHALGWTLLHFCWQGALVAGLLWCVLGLLGGRSSQARYRASCTAMLLMVGLPLMTFGRLAVSAYRARVTADRVPSLLDVNLFLKVRPDGPVMPWAMRAAMIFDHAMPWLLTAWFAGALFFVVRLNLGLFAANALRSEGVDTPGDELLMRFVALRRRLGVTRAVRLLHSARVQAPTVVGWLKPVVLIPASCLTGLTIAQIEAILCHELAHVLRHDYLVSVFQSLAESLLFYHPAVWWVSRQVRRERECCCDEFAVANCGDALDYARALSYLEERRAVLPEFALGANGGVLKMRIKRVLGVNDATGAPQFAAVLLLAAITAIGGCVVLKAHAQSAPEPADVRAQTVVPQMYVVRHENDGAGAVKEPLTLYAIAHDGTGAEVAQVSLQPPPRSLTPVEQNSAPSVVPAIVGVNVTPGTSDLSCTYYDEATRAHAGTCEGTTDANPIYSCRADDGVQQSQVQSSCESKVKRIAVLRQQVSTPASSGSQQIAVGVMEGQLLRRVAPVYPDIARAAHVQGTVVLVATISKQGAVSNVYAIGGPPMLIASAMDAVRQWIYRPYLVEGEPSEVSTTINVNFSFDSSSLKQGAPGDAAQADGGSAGSMPPPSTDVARRVVRMAVEDAATVQRIGGGVTSPILESSVEPEMTEESRKAKFKGVVLVNLIVDPFGKPQNIHVVHGVGMGLDEKAIEAVSKYRFKPAMMGNRPVAVMLNIEVNFQVF